MTTAAAQADLAFFDNKTH